MSYNTILVYLGLPEQVEPVMDVAIKICKKFKNAHLIGLHVVPQIPVYPDMAFMMTAEMSEYHREALLSQRNDIATAFKQAIEGQDISSEWRSIDADGSLVADKILEHGRCVDLIIASQDDPKHNDDTQHGVGEQVMIRAGRPMLFVPVVGKFKTIGENISIAWNASREAARASFDALPLLKKADSINILWADEKKHHSDEAQSIGDELAIVFLRHGVEVNNKQSIDADVSFANELLSRVENQGSDLLIMGGYGHSRMHEFIFGGTTRHILKNMTLPVLMSH